jgi:hypothetical protein
MDQQIAECDDVSEIRHAARKRRIALRKLGQGLTDDFKLAFDGSADDSFSAYPLASIFAVNRETIR